MNEREPLTWTCHVCGAERPDQYIGVATHSLVSPTGIAMKQNVRFCKDRPACSGSAMVNNLTDLALIRCRREKKASIEDAVIACIDMARRHFMVGVVSGIAAGIAIAFVTLGAHL